MAEAAPPFSQNAADRIGRAVREVERRIRNFRGHRGRWHKHAGIKVAPFELAEELVQFSNDAVLAYRRVWDPTANDGWGGLTTDCDDPIYVADRLQTGHTAGVGGTGLAWVRNCSNGTIGVVIDLCCPGEEQGEGCNGGTGT